MRKTNFTGLSVPLYTCIYKWRRYKKMKKVLLIILVLLVANMCYAVEEQSEEVILTTYYPAPYGGYEELQVKEFYVNTQGASANNRYGVINLAGRIVDPDAANSIAGDIYWNDNSKKFRYYDGNTWCALEFQNPEFENIIVKGNIKFPSTYTSSNDGIEYSSELEIKSNAIVLTSNEGSATGADFYIKRGDVVRVGVMDSKTYIPNLTTE